MAALRALTAPKAFTAQRPRRAAAAIARRAVVRVRAEAGATPPTPTPTPTEPLVLPSGAATKAVSLTDAMAFSGPAPETINGRLAMLGIVSALGAEAASGESVLTQFGEATWPVLGAVLVLAAASLVPILKGANRSEAFGPLTPAAEVINGRVAMLGLAGLLAIEAVKGSALF